MVGIPEAIHSKAAVEWALGWPCNDVIVVPRTGTAPVVCFVELVPVYTKICTRIDRRNFAYAIQHFYTSTDKTNTERKGTSKQRKIKTIEWIERKWFGNFHGAKLLRQIERDHLDTKGLLTSINIFATLKVYGQRSHGGGARGLR